MLFKRRLRWNTPGERGTVEQYARLMAHASNRINAASLAGIMGDWSYEEAAREVKSIAGGTRSYITRHEALKAFFPDQYEVYIDLEHAKRAVGLPSAFDRPTVYPSGQERRRRHAEPEKKEYSVDDLARRWGYRPWGGYAG